MHIVFLNALYPPNGPLGGAEATLRFLVQSLSARGHTCSVVTMTPDRNFTQGRVDDAAVYYIPLANVYWPFGNRRPRLLRPIFQLLDAYNPVMRWRLARLLRKLRPDVVHGHNLQGFSVSAWEAARDCRIPLVQTLHDYYLVCPRSAMWRPDRGTCDRQCWECHLFSWPRRRLCGVPATVTCVSHRMMDLVAAAGMFTNASVRVIRGNNPRRNDAPAVARAGGKLHLGFLGRLDPCKGMELLLDAVADLPADAVDVVIAGRGLPDYEQELRHRASMLANVSFVGEVAAGEFLQRLDLLVVPSIWQEPLTRVVAEAFAYGIPSLVTPMGGLPENIIHGVSGLIAPSPDAAGLLHSLREVLAGTWNLAAMREACLAAAEAYAPELIAAQYEAVLDAAARHVAVPGDYIKK